MKIHHPEKVTMSSLEYNFPGVLLSVYAEHLYTRLLSHTVFVVTLLRKERAPRVSQVLLQQ